MFFCAEVRKKRSRKSLARVRFEMLISTSAQKNIPSFTDTPD
jgi:hypothetical protein